MLLAKTPPKSYLQKNFSKLKSGKVKVFDIENNHIVNSNSTHDMYNCPFCIDVRGKPDYDAKFYWCREKDIGYCFKCQTVGVLDNDFSLHERKYSTIVNSFLSVVNDKYKINSLLLKNLPIKDMFQPLNDTAINYLKSRSPFYDLLVGKLPLYSFENKGVVFPVFVYGKCASYSIRFFEPVNKMKYYIDKSEKLLYSPNNIFRKGNSAQEITLVEGNFDAIGAILLGYPNPIGIFGKHLTDNQIYLLRNLCPSKINIFLDETELSWALYHNIKKVFPLIKKPNIIFTDKDPEERFLSYLSYSKDSNETKINKIETALSIIQEGNSSVKI